MNVYGLKDKIQGVLFYFYYLDESKHKWMARIPVTTEVKLVYRLLEGSKECSHLALLLLSLLLRKGFQMAPEKPKLEQFLKFQWFDHDRVS